MPISTNSETWKNGSNYTPLKERVADFLESNPNKAFHERELVDELLDGDWEASHETDRLHDELSEEEFEKRLHNDDLPNSEVPFAQNIHLSLRLQTVLSQLMDEGLIIGREIDPDALGFPYDWDSTTVFTYISK